MIESIEDLRVLIETARAGSLTGAANKLGITPATASATLKRLEARLNARLFERSTRVMRITPQGQLLLDYATRALELLVEGEAQLAGDNQSVNGTIRLSAPSDLMRSVLVPWLDDFLQAHPGIRLMLSPTDRIQDVIRDTVDVALRYGELSDSGLVARQLCSTRRVACASPAYLKQRGTPLEPSHLRDHNCLTFHLNGKRYCDWRFERDGAWQTVHVDGDRDSDDAAIAHQWAVAGQGILYKAELDLHPDLASGALVPLLQAWGGEHYPLNAILPSNRFIPARTRTLLDFLAARCQASMTAMRAQRSPHA